MPRGACANRIVGAGSITAELLARQQAAGRERRQMAGTGQSGVQFDRREPVIQGGPAGEILGGSPRAGCGRYAQRSVTNSSADVGTGSISYEALFPRSAAAHNLVGFRASKSEETLSLLPAAA